ncbi:hypothetical protein BpHYR1_034047, partial [Brachionus plicatilis]
MKNLSLAILIIGSIALNSVSANMWNQWNKRQDGKWKNWKRQVDRMEQTTTEMPMAQGVMSELTTEPPMDQ